ncbi:MAG: hypothetical protein HYW49_01980 [Deltaproteobacteria bacterium]|nr:hypothetical protein [Deltaproteobacteria bacterium]
MLSALCARRSVFFAVFVACAVAIGGCAGTFTRPARAPAQAIARAVQTGVLAGAIAKNLSRVEEFRVIAEAAGELGLRVWLFGGTAAGYAHYVKWDLLRQSGDTRYIESRFDYDFTNIYRSTQDADLVVDGSVEDASKLESLIKSKLAYLQGSKKEWEVRLLRQDRGDKQALLNNPDFMNQHTDSNSTGMVELTAPPSGESVVRDLRDWQDMRSPRFLQDVAEGKLHYYHNPLHKTTSRYLAGDNPEIFSVVRYFTKAFQYELEMREEDLARIREIIGRFHPQTSPAKWSEWARGWIEKRGNGAKLIKHAVNVEYAWNVLEQIGLRQKLIAMSASSQAGSMGWWLNREPLRSKPVGEGGGKTAKEIAAKFDIPWDEFVVAHETGDFLAYESLTRDTTGRPNVLISRKGFAGEVAAYGDGHYTRVGRIGARGTGLTVRYKVDPNAREGTDFIVKDDFMIFRNRNALSVIPESLNIGPVEYFQLLFSSETMDASDRGVLEKLKRRVDNQLARASAQDARAIADTILAELNRKQEPSTQWEQRMKRRVAALNHWFSLPASVNFPEVVTTLINRGYAPFYADLVRNVLATESWRSEEIKQILLQISPFKEYGSDIVTHILNQPHWRSDRKWMESVIDEIVRDGTAESDKALAKRILNQPEWAHRPDWVRAVIARGLAHWELIEHALSKPHWEPYLAEFVPALMARKDKFVNWNLTRYVFSRPATTNHPEWIDGLFAFMESIPSVDYDSALFSSVLSQEWTKAHPEWIERALAYRNGRYDQDLAEYVIWRPHWVERKDWAIEIFERPFRKHYGWHTRQVLDPLFKNVFSQPEWKDDPRLLQIIGNILSNGKMYSEEYWSEYMGRLLLNDVLSQPHWSHRADLIERFLAKEALDYDESIARFILSKPHWDRGQWYERLAAKNNPKIDAALIETLGAPHSVKYPERIRAFIATKRYDTEVMHILAAPQSQWWDHPECEGWIDLLLKRDLRKPSNPEVSGNVEVSGDADVLKILQFPRWEHRSDWKRIIVERSRSLILGDLKAPHENQPEVRQKISFSRRCAGLLKNRLRSWYWRRK